MRFGRLRPFPNRRKLTASFCGRKRGGPETDPPSQGRSPKPKSPSLPQGRWRRTRKGGEADEAAQPSAQADARRDFTKSPMAGTKSSQEPGVTAEPAKAAGIAPWLEPAGKTARGFGPEPRPERVPRRGFGREGGPGKRQGLRAAPRSEGRPEGLRPRCEPGEGAASAGPDPPGKRRRGFQLRLRNPTGIGEGLAPPPRPTGDRTGLRASLRYPGKAAGASGPAAIPKPPSERWPRHPATAVKAGTSGGRWRHRPPLSFPASLGAASASRASPHGPQALFLGKARRHEGARLASAPQSMGACYLDRGRFAARVASCLH